MSLYLARATAAFAAETAAHTARVLASATPAELAFARAGDASDDEAAARIEADRADWAAERYL